MAGGSDIVEKATKLPFANYDLIVYFGVGICSLPVLSRYALSNNARRFPDLFNGFSEPLINNVASLVVLAFVVYVIGHGIALLASVFVEQLLYRSVGAPSAIIAGNLYYMPSNGSNFRRHLKIALPEAFGRKSTPADVIRLVFHAPVLPIYLTMYALRVFGFYESKLSSFVVLRVQQRLEKCFDYNGNITKDRSWFKIVEYACANDHPAAMAKMYNYLLIYGLFRSIAFLTLLVVWLEYFYYFRMGGLGFLDRTGHGSIVFRLCTLYAAYSVSFVGFAKFSRRYSEEAVQSFALSKTFQVE